MESISWGNIKDTGKRRDICWSDALDRRKGPESSAQVEEMALGGAQPDCLGYRRDGRACR